MLNKAQIIGRLGRDPEIRSFQNGGQVCNLSIATTEKWKDKTTGERKERTEWHKVAIFNENLVEVAEQYLKKGTLVYVEGQLETRKWTDQDGKDRYSTEITLRPYRGEIKIMADGVQRGEGTTSGNRDNGPAPRGNNGNNGGGRRQPPGDVLDDDIPF